MTGSWNRRARGVLAAAIVVGIGLPFAVSAGAGATTVAHGTDRATCGGSLDATRLVWMKGFNDPATPDALDKVGVLEVGPSSAKECVRPQSWDLGRGWRRHSSSSTTTSDG
jgi:hypothetical protein